MKKLIIACLLLLLPLEAIAEGNQAAGGVSPAQLSRTGRSFDYVVPVVRTLVTTLSSCTQTATTATPHTYIGNGRDGVIGDATIQNLSRVVWTSTLGQPSYPSRLEVHLADITTTANTLTCDWAEISGYTWNGTFVKERITGITESLQFTVNSFRKVTRIESYGCDRGVSSGVGGTDATDSFVVRVSNWVALPWKIKEAADIDVVCSSLLDAHFTVSNTGASAQKCIDGALLTQHTQSNSINILYNGLGTNGPGLSCPNDRSTILIRGRASPDFTRY